MLGLNAQAEAMVQQNQKLVRIIEALKERWNEEVARLTEANERERERAEKSKNYDDDDGDDSEEEDAGGGEGDGGDEEEASGV